MFMDKFAKQFVMGTSPQEKKLILIDEILKFIHNPVGKDMKLIV